MKSMNIKRLIVCWIAGLLLGTVIVGATSPLFVRSYLPQQLDPVRRQYVPSPGLNYRWRSEGYATTLIGQHGMPGRERTPPEDSDSFRVALWGDSQAEGVCVPDRQKLFEQIQRAAEANGGPVDVLPFARSGDDASNWLAQMRPVERDLDIDMHLLLIVELSDLWAAATAPPPSPANEQTIQSNSRIAATVPAFLIQAARHLLTDADGGRRALRFSIGPVKNVFLPDLRSEKGIEQSEGNATWADVIEAVRSAAGKPVVIVYVPRSPHISAGKIVLHDGQDEQFQAMERAAIAAGLMVIDTRDALGDAAREGNWPHGFHNGQIGDGHLNSVGYQVIAKKIANAVFRSAK